jgi:F0F1-type ATP synthase assembly protein I
MGDETPSDERQRAGIGAAISFGTTFAVGVAVFTAMGWWIDKKRGGETQWFTLGGIFAGLLFGAYELWKLLRLLNGADDSAKKKNDGTGK